MKRVLSLLLVACLLLTLVACTEEQPQNTTPNTQPQATQPQATDPKPTEPKPTETDPAPTETDPAPTETEPKPTEPKPTEPKPTEPKPTEPKPTEPKPTEPKPTEPKPTEPKPTEPAVTPSGDQPVLKFPATSPEEIQNGTATIDGIVDEAYLNSLRVTVDYTMAFNVPVEELTTDKIRADVFFLHDGKYLYIVANVTGDSNVVDTGLTTWVSESVEIWFSNPAGAYSKLIMDAYATPVDEATGFPGNATNRNEDKLKIYQKGVELAAIQYDNGYVVEAKIEIPYYKKSEGALAINVQLNNRYSPEDNAGNFDFSAGGSYGSQASKAESDPEHHSPTIVYLALEE